MKKPYTGALAKPLGEIRWEGLGLFPTDEEWNQIGNAAVAEEIAKIDLLFDHYEIDRGLPDACMRLVYYLATAHVPGLKRIRKAGAPQTWSVMDYSELKIAVDDLRAHQENGVIKSIAWACTKLARHEPWKSRIGKLGNAVEALRRAYYKADPRWTEALRKARSYDAWTEQGQASP